MPIPPLTLAPCPAYPASAPRHPVAKPSSQGFTLLELLVIIGLLVSYVGPRYFAQIDKSKIKVTRLQISELGKALDDYRIDTGHYPSTEAGLDALNAPCPHVCTN